jgi:glutamate dehydrogenase
VTEEFDALIAERVGPERAATVRAFAHAYLRRLSAEDENGHDAQLAAEVIGAFELAASRDGEPAAVRVFNPTLETHGYQAPGTVVETNTEDLPFLVDSVSAELQARGLGIRRVMHPIVGTVRDSTGAISSVLHPAEATTRESVMHFDLDRRLPEDALSALEESVREVFSDVRSVVRDFRAMKARVHRMIEFASMAGSRYSSDEIDETVAFLEWLLDENFVFLGYREYDVGEQVTVSEGSGLGLLAEEGRSSYAEPVALSDLDDAMRKRITDGDLLTVAKSNRSSTVHRRSRMEYIGVRKVAGDGGIVGEARMLGIFTTKAYAAAASETPLLHRKLRQLIESEDLIPGSHDYKAAVSLFDSFPKDELFGASTEELRHAVITLLGTHGDQVRLLGRRQTDERGAALVLSLPAARYGPELQERLETLLRERFEATSVAAAVVYGDDDRVRVHFSVHVADGQLAEVDMRELEREVIRHTRTWDDLLGDLLVAELGPERGPVVAAEWGPRYPGYYKASIEPALAVNDTLSFQRLAGTDDSFVIGLQNEARGEGLTRVALYKRGGKVELSRFMPILEDLGLEVIEEVPTRLLGGDGQTWVQDFGVRGPDGRPLDLDRVGPRVADAITAVFRGDAESDSLNRLVLLTDLNWQQLTILRAYRRYRQRIGSRYTEGYQNDVIAANPEVTAKLMRLFELRFDPAETLDETAQEALREEILADLDAVTSLDHDRILRNQLGMIGATLRTNAYKPGRDAISFKLRSDDVPAIPRPAPMFEIFVYSQDMEGIHLRGGKIARGGLRWSDRMDYRTEVYGLMRAQQTKNAVIVPAGAKGGFLLKRPPAERAELLAEVELQYVRYIRALLDVTDNLVDGEVVHPEGVRVHDEDDTYLVVAADKGTATLSDTANAISEQYGFWLGDAFASGGSAGYDHKKLGITARGAWESVKRHFAEMGMDPAVDEFTAVGIGDMSGDVFGNGMLLSDKLKLVAAYDHRHIFIDPSPDPARSFAERQRLFELRGSSWDDYDKTLISEGGGVWPRSAKSIPLSDEARAALGIEDAALPPNDVIRAILRAPADLLWNGGIGTVVKASDESDDDAQDRSSDAIRVDARDLRVRVIGEGGNLGLTRRARIEFSAAGGRVNADFIDNAGGVNCSDHEVNLKVLLSLAERRGDLTREQRDALLLEVTEDVVQHVLYDSFLQAQILSQEYEVARDRVYPYEDLMSSLEADGLLDRASEELPAGEELAERRRTGRGLERPELATLLAYAKRRVARRVESSELPDEPWLERDLRSYFPPAVVERFGDLLTEHPLRRQLIAMINAGMIVNALGPTFVSRLVVEHGAETAEIVRAFRIAREVTDAERRWKEIEQLGRTIPRSCQLELMTGVDGLVEAATRWWVQHEPTADIGERIEACADPFAELEAALPQIESEAWAAKRAQTSRALTDQGVPEGLAQAHALLPRLVQGPGILAVATITSRSVADVARAFAAVGDELRIDWLEEQLEALPGGSRTQGWAVQAVREDALAARRELAERALAGHPGAAPEEAVEAFLAEHERSVERLHAFLRSLALEGIGDLAGVTLAVRHLRTLAD